MELPDGVYVLSNTYPAEYLETKPDRKRQWKAFRDNNAGRIVSVFDSWQACEEEIEEVRLLRERSLKERGNIISPADICEAYLSADESLPDDPKESAEFKPGNYWVKMSKRLLMSLPTGARISSGTRSDMGFGPAFEKEVPPLPKREGFWLEIRNNKLDGRSFDVKIPHK